MHVRILEHLIDNRPQYRVILGHFQAQFSLTEHSFDEILCKLVYRQI